eukprot:CFRG4884T1
MKRSHDDASSTGELNGFKDEDEGSQVINTTGARGCEVHVLKCWLFATYRANAGRPKATKKEIIDLNLKDLCQDIMYPKEPLALRLSSNLLVGVSRIYNKQQMLFWADARSIWTQVQKKAKEITSTNLLLLQTDQAKAEAITLNPDEGINDTLVQQLLENLTDKLDLEEETQHFSTSQIPFTSSTIEIPRDDLLLSPAYMDDQLNDHQGLEITLDDQLANNLTGGFQDDLDTIGQLDLSLDLPGLDEPRLDGNNAIASSAFDDVDIMGMNDTNIASHSLDLDDSTFEAQVPNLNDETIGLHEMDSLVPDKTTPHGPRRYRRRAKRSLQIDKQTTISGAEMRANLADASGLIVHPKKVVIIRVEIDNVLNSFTAMVRFGSTLLLELYTRNVKPIAVDEHGRKPDWWINTDMNQRETNPRNNGYKNAENSPAFMDVGGEHQLGYHDDQRVNYQMDDLAGIFHDDIEIELPRDRQSDSENLDALRTSTLSAGQWKIAATPPVEQRGVKRLSGRLSSDESGSDTSRRQRRRIYRGTPDLGGSSSNELLMVTERFELDHDQPSQELSQALKEDTKHFYRHIVVEAGPTDKVKFLEMLPKQAQRSLVAKAFYQLVVLANLGAVNLVQREAYGDVNIKITHEMF